MPIVDVHNPEIAPRSAGVFGVFCAECSRIAHDYVYPCKLGAWPFEVPLTLVAWSEPVQLLATRVDESPFDAHRRVEALVESTLSGEPAPVAAAARDEPMTGAFTKVAFLVGGAAAEWGRLVGELTATRAENERLTEFGIDLPVHEKVVAQFEAAVARANRNARHADEWMLRATAAEAQLAEAKAAALREAADEWDFEREYAIGVWKDSERTAEDVAIAQHLHNEHTAPGAWLRARAASLGDLPEGTK